MERVIYLTESEVQQALREFVGNRMIGQQYDGARIFLRVRGMSEQEQVKFSVYAEVRAQPEDMGAYPPSTFVPLAPFPEGSTCVSEVNEI